MRFKQQTGFKELNLQTPKVMGVLNVTPDSFSDGGRFYQANGNGITAAVDHAERMIEQGASFIDIGGESTRPGASPVPLQQELDRVIPVVEKVAAKLDCIISVDSSSPQLMTEAAAAGAGLLNDVRAFQRDGALEAAAASGLPMCLMHMRGEPETMQLQPTYASVLEEVRGFLVARVKCCEAANINSDRLLIDPGFGFGKTLSHNIQLLNGLEQLRIGSIPLLVGLSRKSMIGAMLASAAGPRDVADRLYGGLALATIAVMNGASIIRSHDVGATSDALRVAHQVSLAAGAESGVE